MKISELVFKETIQGSNKDHLFSVNTDHGRITVLDRMTGWGGGGRDVETGYTDKNDRFWVASGQFDIRSFPDLEILEAIEKIKENANTCIGISGG